MVNQAIIQAKADDINRALMGNWFALNKYFIMDRNTNKPLGFPTDPINTSSTTSVGSKTTYGRISRLIINVFVLWY